MPEPISTPETIVTPEEIAALRSSGPWWEWRLHTDKELEELLRQEKEKKMKEEIEKEREKKAKEEQEKQEKERQDLETKIKEGITWTLEDLEKEFDRQVATLIQKEVPRLAGISSRDFISILQPLKERLPQLAGINFPEGHIPFVIVLREKLLSLEKQITLMEVDGQKGFTTLDFSEFKTAEGIEIPESMAYLMVDVENGRAMDNKSPDEAVQQFQEESRSPLTAGEGVALILQHPEILKDHSMDLLGSRYGEGVAALWLLSVGKLKLDWRWMCFSVPKWGSASCFYRI